MIKILYILKKEFLLIIRDIHAVTVLFIMPAVFIMIMSLAMRDLFELHSTVSIDVLAVNQDAGKKSEAFLKAMDALRTFRFHLIEKEAAAGKGKDEKPLELLVNPAVNVQTQLVLKSALDGKLAKLTWDTFINRMGNLLNL